MTGSRGPSWKEPAGRGGAAWKRERARGEVGFSASRPPARSAARVWVPAQVPPVEAEPTGWAPSERPPPSAVQILAGRREWGAEHGGLPLFRHAVKLHFGPAELQYLTAPTAKETGSSTEKLRCHRLCDTDLNGSGSGSFYSPWRAGLGPGRGQLPAASVAAPRSVPPRSGFG